MQYLNHLADEAHEWFDKRPENAQALAHASTSSGRAARR